LEEVEEEEDGLCIANDVNEEDPERDRATPLPRRRRRRRGGGNTAVAKQRQ
jgi:hypothetical protein